MDLPTALFIDRGGILHSDAFDNIDHGKFFVVIGKNDDGYVGFFFINSNINPINQKPEQMKMQYLLRRSDYGFLRYDSYLCCTEITTIEKGRLDKSLAEGRTIIKGVLKSEHVEEVLKMVRESKLFTKVEKETFFK